MFGRTPDHVDDCSEYVFRPRDALEEARELARTHIELHSITRKNISMTAKPVDSRTLLAIRCDSTIQWLTEVRP